MSEEYNNVVIMLKHAYSVMGIKDLTRVCNQIRKIYALLKIQYETRGKLLTSHLRIIKQYLKTISSWDENIIMPYGKQVISTLE